MKSSLIRSLVIFVAGAATASVAAGLYPKRPITKGQFQERMLVLIAEVEELGAYVAVTEKGRVGIYTDPGFCIPPDPPLPVLPPIAVNSITLALATRAMNTMNEGALMGENSLVYEVGRCKPAEGIEYKN